MSMPDINSRAAEPLSPATSPLVPLAKAALKARSCHELAEGCLAALAETVSSGGVFLYLAEASSLPPRLFHFGIEAALAAVVEELCEERLQEIASRADPFPASVGPGARVVFQPLKGGGECLALAGYLDVEPPAPAPRAEWEEAVSLIGDSITRLSAQARVERENRRLNTYLTVSSMLSQPLGLHELIEAALYCCKEAAAAEEASVMLLDEEKENLCFYEIGGDTKAALVGAKFPASKGLAGHVLLSQEAEIVNDVQHDPRFYGSIDSDSGFRTRNMIVIPLTAGEEKIGILSAVNKVDGDSFLEEDRQLLLLIAEEIAFAVRNAKVFEYVVGTYCKQRQGQASCKGCKRPLGSWTPCVKYREAEGIL